MLSVSIERQWKLRGRDISIYWDKTQSSTLIRETTAACIPILNLLIGIAHAKAMYGGHNHVDGAQSRLILFAYS